MHKLLDYASITDDRQNLYTIRPAGGMLTKHASADNKFAPEIAEFIRNLTPKENCHYSLCTALGAGEYWSSNVNGDFFERDELINNHHTFLKGTPFMHHVNKDPNKGYGKILFSTYNPRMNRVELVVEYDTNKLPADITKKLENDDLVNLSMGCRVAYDTCSICGNKAPTPRDYCDHVTKTGLNTVFPDGRKVFVYNPNPDFFDISIVIVPADKTACVLAKIFGANKIAKKATDPLRGFRSIALPSSAALPSSINAELSAKTASVNKIYDNIPNHSWEEIKAVADATKTAGGLIASIKLSNAYLKPNEVQAVLFAQNNMNKIAQSLLKHNAYFDCAQILPLNIDSAKGVKLPNNFAKHAAIIKAASEVSPLTGLPVEELDSSILGMSPETLNDIARMSMLSAIVGATMAGDWGYLMPLIGIGANMAANSLVETDNMAKAEKLRAQLLARDLYIEPLIRSKKASCCLTLSEIYSIPLIV